VTVRQQMFVARTVRDVIGGTMVRGDLDTAFVGVSTDSRSIRPGELFFALKGEKFDGHAFISEVVRRNGKGIVVDRHVHGLEDTTVPVILVGDTLQALGDLATFWRKEHPIPLAAIVGSNGKTTTKEMLATILAECYTVLKNPGNFNNLIGLPLSLLELNSRHQVAVLEMGMNRRGEIRRLTQIADPNLAVLTNINQVHLEGLGSLKGVMEAKGELLEIMNEQARLIFNADDPNVITMSKQFGGKRTSFGVMTSADWTATVIRNEKDRGISFQLRGPHGTIPVFLKVIGDYQLYNALAASAAAYHLNVQPDAIKRGLEAFRPLSMRMELLTVGNNITIINDTYNANPQSMRLALTTLKNIAKGRQIAVLGDMAELGNYAPQAHTDVGRSVRETGVAILYVLGDFASYVVQGAIDAGMNPRATVVANNHDDLSHDLAKSLKKGDWVLVKGSRATKMETIIDTLRNIL